MTDRSPRSNDLQPRSRRWLLGLEPIFEGGWLHRGARADRWDVEDELVAVSILGDVVVDLTRTRTLPAEVVVNAFALGRDVEIIVPDGTRVELRGRPGNDHLSSEAPAVGEACAHTVRVVAHTALGDVSVRSTRPHG